MQFRKKPVVIEAVKWTGENLQEVIDLIGLHPSPEKWSWAEYCEVVRAEGLKIFTLEGTMMASIGDYIIKGVNGECYPCKPDIFAKTYEAAEDCKGRDSQSVAPTVEFPANRLLNAFPRPDALNELYAIGPVDHNGLCNMYSIWRGNYSIMGMTGIIFQVGRPGDPGEQEGVKETDLLEIVHDRILQKLDVFAETEEMVYAASAVQTAIKTILQYERKCRGEETDGEE